MLSHSEAFRSLVFLNTKDGLHLLQIHRVPFVGREVLVVFIPHLIAVVLAFVALAIPIVLFRLLWKLGSKLR